MQKNFLLRSISFWISLLCSFVAFDISAQRPTPSRVPGSQGGPGVEFGDVLFSEDTLDVKYYYLAEPTVRLNYQDTFLQYFHEFNLDKIRGQQFFNLGYPTAPVRSVIAAPATRVGYHLGLNAYDPFRLDDHNFRFYQIKKALTYASYVQGQTQSDGIFRAIFARDFKDGLQLSFDYNRANNLGIYQRQAGQQTNLAVGMRYVSKSHRFQLHGVHYANTFSQENNGGITSDSSYLDEVADQRLNIPVFLNAAETRDQQRVYQLQGTYRLLGKDSTQNTSGLLAQVKLRSEERIFKYFDNSPSLAYYGDYWTHDAGIRNFIQQDQLSTHFNLQFAGNRPNQLIQVGLKNIRHNIDLDNTDEKINDWVITSGLNWILKDRLGLEASGDFGTNKFGAYYAIKGRLTLDLAKAGRLLGEVRINQRQPSQIERNLFLSQGEIWNNDFKNVLNNHLTISYQLPAFDLEVSAGQVLSSNPIYFQATGIPSQIDGITSLTFLRLFKSFRLGSFVNENQIILQQPGNRDVFRVPTWYAKNSLYFDGYLFKKVLNLKTGFEIRIHDSFDGISFAPFLGQFTIDDSHTIASYPMLDYHLAIKVGFLRAFVLLENILQPWQDLPYFPSSRYPGQDFTLRVGLSWIFIN